MLHLLRAHSRIAGLGLAVALAVGGWLGYRWLVTTALPPLLHSQLSALFQRDVAFQRVELGLSRGFTVEGVSVARTLDPESPKLFTMRSLALRFNFWRLVTDWREPHRAIRRVILIEPSLEVPLEQIAPLLTRGGGRTKPRETAPGDTVLPPLPKSYLEIKNASLTVTRRGIPVLEVRRLGANLDLRDLPHVEGGIHFTLAPEARVNLHGNAHFALRKFGGGIQVESLDLGQLSDLARMVNPRIPTRIGGRLDARLEIEGGFMTVDELLDHTAGRGSLKLTSASLDLRGNPLITDTDAVGTLDGRQIELEQLTAKVLSGALDATGSLGNLGQGRLRLRGTLDDVPVRALRALSPGLPESLDGVFSFQFSATGTGEAPVFTGRIASPGLGVSGVRPEAILAEMTYTPPQAVALTNLRMSLWGGTFQGAGGVTGLDGGSPLVRFDLSGTGFDVVRSPIGPRGYGGTADLVAKLAGPPDALTGTLALKIAGVTALRRPVGDLTAAARFEAGVVTVAASTASKSLAIAGALVLPGGLAFRDLKLDVRERLPTILAIAGVEPHPGLDGQASGSIRLEGTASDMVITADVVGSAVRLGRVSIGDVVRIPRFVFNVRRMTMEIPEALPARLEWGDHDTRLQLFGSVPVGVFTAAGQESMHLAVSAEGQLAFLERLDLIRKAEGTFTANLRLGGTAATPFWESVDVQVSGRRLALKEPVFDRDFEGLNLNLTMRGDEGVVKDSWVGLDRQRQTLAGRFGMSGWKFENVEMTTRTTSEKPKHLRGLPLAIDDVAEIRVLLNASVAQRPGETAIVLTGPDPEKGAELTIQNGTIMYAGPRIGESRAAIAATISADSGNGRREPGWWERLNFVGTVSVGRNVTYAPRSAASKAGSSFWKLLTGDRAALKKYIAQYASKAGVLEFFRQTALGFDLRIREGSSIRLVKEYDALKHGDSLRAFGEVALEPRGKVSMGPMTFTLVDEPGLQQRIGFIGNDPMEAHVALVAETTLYDKKLSTGSGEVATVEELKVRLKLTPPDPSDFNYRKQEGFMQFSTDIVSEPEKVAGEVAIAPSAGTEGDPAAGPQTRPVSFTPDKGSLMLALFGLDSLAAVGSSAAAAGGSTVGSEITQSAATGIINAILSPIRKLLGLDVLSVRKSELANRRKTGGAAASTTPGGASQKGSAFDNTELTAGVALPFNLFLNQHVILLDAGGLSARGTSGLTANQSSPTGFITELEFRRSGFKIKTKGRWFGLPDDPQVLKKYELFGGIEVNQGFQGVSRREPFVW